MQNLDTDLLGRLLGCPHCNSSAVVCGPKMEIRLGTGIETLTIVRARSDDKHRVVNTMKYRHTSLPTPARQGGGV